jgi:5-methylcytosine-specific restriction endonuclease McrA
MARPKGEPTVAQVKAAVRARDGFRCVKCGMTNHEHLEATEQQLEVHRVVPGSVYSLDGCVTLCKRCHGPEPRRRRGEAGIDRLGLNRPTHDLIAATARAMGISSTELARMILLQNVSRYAREAGVLPRQTS